MKALRIGELARQANVDVQTPRFYERKGLLPKPPRRASGYREYPPEAVETVKFIQRARELGFSLREIKELLRLRKGSRSTCGNVAAVARRKIEEIDAKISALRAMRNALTELRKECSDTTVPVVRCPIVESLAGEARPEGNRRVPADRAEEV